MDAVAFGYDLGVIPQQSCSDFPADPKLLQTALDCCAQHLPEVKVHTGRVVSGDVFVAKKEQKDFLRSQFSAACTEMEGAAIAHAAWLNGVPYLVVRAISDNADAGAVEDYPAADVVARDCYDRLLAENDELRKERPVVRCKDCICFHPIGTSKHNGDCDKHYERVQGDDYCSWAEVEQDD